MEWISVKDRLPEQSEVVLSTDGDTVAVIIYHYYEGLLRHSWSYLSSGCGCCDTDMEKVTHWMPLPKRPKEPKTEPHPWSHFLNSRWKVILWMKQEKQYDDKQIAEILSMDERQVFQIRNSKDMPMPEPPKENA